MKPRVVAMICAALLGLAQAREARAQAQPDTAGLLESGLSVLATDVARMGYEHRLEVEEGPTAFDLAMAVRLRALPEASLPSPLPGHRDWIGTSGVSLDGDTAAVLVRVGTTRPPDGQLINTYIEVNRYLFIHEPSGWRFLRREFVSGADIGPVRG